MMDQICKLQPHRTIALQGFDDYGAAAAPHRPRSGSRSWSARSPALQFSALCVDVNAPLAGRLGLRLVSRNAGQDHRIAVGEFSHQRQASAHGLNGLPQSGNHQIGALFKLGNTVLPDSEFLGHANLSEPADVAKFLQSHFLGDELNRASRHLLAPGGAELLSYLFQVGQDFVSGYSAAGLQRYGDGFNPLPTARRESKPQRPGRPLRYAYTLERSLSTRFTAGFQCIETEDSL